MESKDVYAKVRQEQEDRQKEELKEAKVKCEQYMAQIMGLNEDIQKL